MRQNHCFAKGGKCTRTASHRAIGGLRRTPEVKGQGILYFKHPTNERITVEYRHSSSDCTHLGIRQKGRNHFSHCRWLNDTVRINGQNDFAASSDKSLIKSSALASVTDEADKPHQIRKLFTQMAHMKIGVI